MSWRWCTWTCRHIRVRSATSCVLQTEYWAVKNERGTRTRNLGTSHLSVWFDLVIWCVFTSKATWCYNHVCRWICRWQGPLATYPHMQMKWGMQYEHAWHTTIFIYSSNVAVSNCIQTKALLTIQYVRVQYYLLWTEMSRRQVVDFSVFLLCINRWTRHSVQFYFDFL